VYSYECHSVLTEAATVAVAERKTAERTTLFQVVREGVVAIAFHVHGAVRAQPSLRDEAVSLGEHLVITRRHVVVQNKQRLYTSLNGDHRRHHHHHLVA